MLKSQMSLQSPEMMLRINDNATNNSFVVNETTGTSLDVFLLVLKSTVMTLIMCTAVAGNLLVIGSVVKFERLRSRVTNYFIVSLAFADILVAVLVMPFNASMEISEKWIFGSFMCDVFNSNDVLFSTSSILHICCISMDRYIAIMKPLKYERKMTKFRALSMIAVTWIASLLISYIPIHSQLYTTHKNALVLKNNPNACTFVVNRLYAIISSSVSFWIPCTIMVFVYIRIFIEARKQEKHIRSASVCSNKSNALYPNRSSRDISDRKTMKREHKAAKTLGIIMGVFILCFFPFFSWYLITSMCKDLCPYPPILGKILFWIGYSNSCLNPIIYAYYNREFRQAFKRLLKMKSQFDSYNFNHCSSGDTKDTAHVPLVYLNGNGGPTSV
ncbi:octopamine receptor beta-2R-like [Mytilus californianus]|uniref:octopamine receptor beta-2R-like n=1 Tax=Mytilus californianus TaxID=6549 RepID=UPI002247EABC|nr:octopamine receptor beta-2R-like [Mytilus californianus]